MIPTDYNPYYIMDSHLASIVHHVLLLSIEMAKKNYPHLVDELQHTEDKYRSDLETFIGTQNKPNVHKAYKEESK